LQPLELPRDQTAPALARNAVSELGLEQPVLDDARLLVSELVTNSVRYGAGAHVCVRLDLDGAGGVRCEVVDAGSGFHPTRPATERDAGGWGLQLVDRLADRWGVADGSTHVWFELSGGDDRQTPRGVSTARA
jgi:anti-sigma regulatory factor (Ser/Thr protein kinase)